MNTDGQNERDVRDEFDNSFDVPLPPAEAWPVLSDIRRIAPSIPGVQLTDVLDERTYQGTISVPLGPVALTFASVVKLEEIDPVNHTARLQAQGADANGRAGAHGTVSFRRTAVPGCWCTPTSCFPAQPLNMAAASRWSRRLPRRS